MEAQRRHSVNLTHCLVILACSVFNLKSLAYCFMEFVNGDFSCLLLSYNVLFVLIVNEHLCYIICSSVIILDVCWNNWGHNDVAELYIRLWNRPKRELSLDSVFMCTPWIILTVASVEHQVTVVSNPITCHLGNCWTWSCDINFVFNQ